MVNNMKKTINFLTLLFTCLVIFSACSAKEALDESSAKNLAENHIQSIVNGEYEKVSNDFNESIKKKIDTQSLKVAYENVTKVSGNYIGVYSANYTSEKNIATVVTLLEYENNGVSVSISYDLDGKICGIWLNNVNIKTQLTNNEFLEEKEITVGEYNLKGVVTTPKNTENYPVAVLVQGSGQSDFDETIGGNKPFKEIAHRLAENGIASVRINKRLYQNPDLMNEDITIWKEYMDDIYAAIDWVKENVSEDVYIIGHSQGAMSGAKIALDNDVKGLVMMAGTTRELEEIVYDQNIATLEIDENYSKKEKEKIIDALEKGIEDIHNLEEGDNKIILGIPSSYWLSLRDLDTENILKNELDIPVLILQGEKDFQVSYEKDFLMMKDKLSENKNIEFISYENLNHLFMPQSKPGVIDVSEYEEENHIEKKVTDDISNFILKNTSNSVEE